MKHFWSNSKEELVAVEEGKANLEPIPENGCKKFMRLVQFILVIEITLFLGWVCFSFYQSKYVTPVEVKDDILRINPVGALKNSFKLSPESPSHSDVITLKEKSSQNKAFDPSLSSEPWSVKTQNVENPESSTERDSVLFNEDSVYYPQSSSPDVTTTPEVKPSTEYVQEITEDSEVKNKSLEGEKIENSEKDLDKSSLDILQTEAAIGDLEIVNKMISEPAIEIPDIINEAPKIVEPETGKVVEEISSEIPQMPILVTEIENSSMIDDYKKELEQKNEKMLDNSQNAEFSLPSFIQILHDLDRTEAKVSENISATEIVPSYLKMYHFQFSAGSDTGIQENDNENSQEVPNQPPFFIRVFFNVSDGDISSADSALQSEESVSDPISSFIDPEFPKEPKSEDSPSDAETPLKWWVNIPELQQTQAGDLTNVDYAMESESESEEFAIKHFIDLFSSQPDSESAIPELDKVEDKSNEDIEDQPENSDTLLTDIISHILPDEKDPYDEFVNEERNSMESINDEAIEKIFSDELIPKETGTVSSKEVPPSEELQKEMDDFLKALENLKTSDDDPEIAGSETESHLYQEECMTTEEEKVSEEIPEMTENKLDSKNEENLFHSQSNWKEDSDTYLKDLLENFQSEIDEYDESSNFESKEYMYD